MGNCMLVDCSQKGKVLEHTWSTCIGAGRAGEGLRSKWRDQLKEAVKECGFKYIRFHGLLAEDMFPVNIKNGVVQYNWYYIDDVYDYLHEIGIRPIVELGFMPPDFASGDRTCFWWKANVTPPKDYEQWGNLIFELTKHFVERYGLEEVQKWYFEVWNEPNLAGFWSGTKSDYFHLYKVSVEAVKKVNQNLKVGGPATSNFVPDERFDGEIEDVSKQMTHQVKNIDELDWHGVWIKDFLDFCEKENLPVDFVSAHPYPTDFALDGMQKNKGKTRKLDAVHDDIEWLLKTVKSSKYSEAEIQLTEWSSSPTSRDYSHDSLAEATYIIRTNLCCQGMVNSLSYWVFTDIFEEGGGGPEPFHGGFGLINMSGIKKSSYQAYRLLNNLGTYELMRSENYIVTKDEAQKVQILCYNYPEKMKETIPIVPYGDINPLNEIMNIESSKTLSFNFQNLTPNASFSLEILNKDTSPLDKWMEMKMPCNLTINQEEDLKKLEPLQTTYKADNNGDLNFEIELKSWEVALLKQE